MDALNKQRVLVVDDEPQVLVALEDLLADRFVVLTSQSGQTALDIVERERDIAVVITDQRMPRMTGDELLVRLAQSTDALRILVTGYADLSAVTRAVNDGGIFAYVTKPWDPADLRMKVDRAADHFRLEKELAFERQLLHDLMDSTPDAIEFKDRELRFVKVNRAFAAMVNQPEPHAVVGKRAGDLGLARADDASIEAEEQEILRHGRALADVQREVTVGGAQRWLSSTKAPIRDAHGAVIGLVGISRDVTERVLAALALRASEERERKLHHQLSQSQKMEAVGQLAGGVAHDFNNLLSVIVSYARLIDMELGEDDPIRNDLNELMAAAQRAAALTRQLLAFGRKQVIEPRPLNLNDVVLGIEKMLARIIGEDIQLVTALTPELGTVNADPGQVEQIIVNLTANARDAMPEGGKLTVETANVMLDDEYVASNAGVVPGDYVLLAVTDTGTGIDRETQQRIFEPFFTTKPVGKGTGLGLSTVYGIVSQSSGHIGMYSELGRGTAFKIYLPRIDAPVEVEERPSQKTSYRAASGKIVLVEDDDAVRLVAARILRDAGYEVLEAARPSDARALCERHAASIDLLLTDVVMPETSGPKLVEELRATLPALRVLYMSGYPGAAIVQSGSLDRAAAFLPKPFTPASLIEKVHDTIQASKKRAH